MEIKVLHQVMEWNEDVSAQVKRTLGENKVCLVNVMGSPGCGKTSFITELIGLLREEFSIGVIEGDIAGPGDPLGAAEYGWGLPHRGHEHPAYFAPV